MAIDPKLIDKLLAEHGHRPQNIAGENGLLKQLTKTVIETARAAAFEDTRFWPVPREELPGLQVSLSILTKPKPTSPEQVEVGRHGLIVSMAGRRGLLLPQVPVEHNWDRIAFLEQTCRKAGLRVDAWQKGASIEAFTAEVFGE